MSEHAASMPGALLGASMLGVLGNADVTGRYGTERKSRQDPDENSRLSYSPDPVDNPEMDRRVDRWMVADEQFELHIGSLQVHAGRRTRLARERWEPTPEVEAARAFEEKTDQLRRMIAVERERWLTERRTA